MEPSNYQCKECLKPTQPPTQRLRLLSDSKCPECLGISYNTLEMAADLIIEGEGYRSQVYKDTLGYETIGYGHLLLANEKGVLNEVTHEEGLRLLQMDMGKAISEFRQYWGEVELGEPREACLIDMTYNMGSVRWPKFTKNIKEGDYREAAIQVMNSKYATQVGKRAKRNACIIRDGVFYNKNTQNWDGEI